MMKLLRRAAYFLRRRQAEADLAEELAFHEAMIRRDMEEDGTEPTQARAAGRRAMGNRTLAREDARAVWIWPWLESVFQDLSYGLRSLRREPGFTLVAVLALAFGIGLNTSLFTVFNALALRPWPVKDPDRVVTVFAIAENRSRGLNPAHGFGPVEHRYLSEHSKTMTGLVLTRGEGGLHLDQAPKTRVGYTTANYFSVLGVDMARGRGFLPEEDRPESPSAVMVLSHSIWQNRYGSDPSIIGRRLQLDEIPFTVVGVAPEGFSGTSPEVTEIWLPFAGAILLHPNDRWARDFLTLADSCCAETSGRLAPGFTREQARAELSVLHADFLRQRHETGNGVVLAGTPFLQQPRRQTREMYAMLGLIFAGVMMVLLLACANIGNLLLARAAARAREIGVRLSLGAGRWRVVRQLLTESMALALIAAALGLTLAWFLPPVLFRSMAGGEVSLHLQPDTTVLAYSVALAAFSCLLFGLAPSLHATRGRFNDALRKQPRGAGRLRGLLLTVQVTLSVILLTGAGLLVRGIQRAQKLDTGFAIEGVAGVTFDFPISAYGGARMNDFFTGIEQGLRELPGAPRFGWTLVEPLGSERRMGGVRFSGEDDKHSRPILSNGASGGYFDVLRIPILAGRNFEAGDRDRKVVLINQAFVDRYFPGQSPLGKTIYFSDPHQIVGVVGNASVWGLEPVEPCFFTPVSFGSAPRLLLAQNPANIAALQALSKNLDARVQLRITPLKDNFDRWLSSSRIGAVIAGMLGLLAVVLASIGIAGVFAYVVQQRTKEIGIRIALGARPADVIAVVVGSAARSLTVGLALGLVGALAVSRLLEQYLYGLSRLDPITYTAVIATLALAGLAATYLPARRAVKLNPVQALHYE